MKSISEPIYARGLAIGGVNIATGEYDFRFREERFVLKSMALDEGRPHRYVATFQIPELRFGFVSKIEEVRQAAALEAA